jgi:hypothetical protein
LLPAFTGTPLKIHTHVVRGLSLFQRHSRCNRNVKICSSL